MTPGAVARRLGTNLLARLNLRYSADGKNKLQEQLEGLLPLEQFHSIDEFVQSAEGDQLQDRLRCLEHSLLFPGEVANDRKTWRIIALKLEPDKSTFLAALCDPKVRRPTVLAFRNFALANAKSSFLIRAYDAQKEAAREYSRNLSAVSHGYKGPLKRLEIAINENRSFFNAERDASKLSLRLLGIREMLTAAKTLANDAIFYAWREEDFHGTELLRWRRINNDVSLEKGLYTVITALNLPGTKEIDYLRNLLSDADAETIEINSSPLLWRHMLAKLIENGIEHSSGDSTREANARRVQVKVYMQSKKLIVEIRNPVHPDWITDHVTTVHRALVKGNPEVQEHQHGYGLAEVSKCCRLLKIGPNVREENSELVITLPLAIAGRTSG